MSLPRYFSKAWMAKRVVGSVLSPGEQLAVEAADMNSFFALISRMRYIGRWGLMRSSIPENVQEHSHMVAVIAHALGVIRREVFGRRVRPGTRWRPPRSSTTRRRSSPATCPRR